jgi:Putative papain-like cysteine peptidase (DUF1796)
MGYTRDEHFMEDYEQIKAKYEKRITRFVDTICSSKNLLFIRKKITKKQAIKLDLLLSTLFAHLSYTILALDGTDQIKQN